MRGSTLPIRERLAAYAHEAWAGWMTYLFRFGVQRADGAFTIDADKVARWRRQMETPYADLSEAERDSDRIEARQIMEIAGLTDEGPPRYCRQCQSPVFTGQLVCGTAACARPSDDTLSARDALDALRVRHVAAERALERACWLIGPMIGERLPQQGTPTARELRETLVAVYDVCRAARAPRGDAS